jgi:hypothetical protein
MHLYIEDADCNHITTTCTHCGAKERIYAHAHHFLGVMNELGAGVSLHAEADDALRRLAKATWDAHDGREATEAEESEDVVPELPEAPKAFLRELYDDLRNWRGEAI